MDEFAQTQRTSLGRRAKSALTRVLPTLRSRFVVLLIALVGASLSPFLIARHVHETAQGFAHRLERAGSLRYRLLAQSRTTDPRESSRLLEEQRKVLTSLIEGDPAEGMPACGSPEICERLRSHLVRWDSQLAPWIRAAAARGHRDPALDRAVDSEVERLDQTVRLDAAFSEYRIERTGTVGLWGSLGALALIGLVGFGVWEVFDRIRRLGAAAAAGEERRISAEGIDDDEIGGLARVLAAGLRKERAGREQERRRLVELTVQQDAVRSSTQLLSAWLAEQGPIEPALARIAVATGHREARLLGADARSAEAPGEQVLPLAWGKRTLGALVLSDRTASEETESNRTLTAAFVQLLTIACLARSLLDQREQRRRLAAGLVGVSNLEELGARIGELVRDLIPHDRAALRVFDEPRRSAGEIQPDATHLAVQLATQDGSIGVLELERTESAFDASDQEVANALAPIVASAVLRMQLHARLREAERWSALGAFGRHLAHELKNPLNSLLLRVSLLERESKRARGGSDATSEHTRVIRDEATRLGRLIDDGLGALPSRGVPSTVDLRDAVQGAIAQLDETLLGTRIELVLELGTEPARVRAEPDRLRQVVLQMLEDAFGRVGAEPGPRVRASIVRAGDDWQLAVERTGPHFADAAELFRPGAEQSVASTGMELAFSRRVVRALGGELGAENMSPSGARMTLTLPVAQS